MQTSLGSTKVDSLKAWVCGSTTHLIFPRRASFQKLWVESETLPVSLGFPSGWSEEQPAKYLGSLERWPQSKHRGALWCYEAQETCQTCWADSVGATWACPGNPKHSSCAVSCRGVRQAAFPCSVWREPCASGRAGLGEVGSWRGVVEPVWSCCGSAPCPEPVAKVLAPLCSGMLSSDAGSHAGPVSWRAAHPSSERSPEQLHSQRRGCTRLFAWGHLFWEVKVGALQCVSVILSAGADFSRGCVGSRLVWVPPKSPLNCQVSSYKGGVMCAVELGKEGPQCWVTPWNTGLDEKKRRIQVWFENWVITTVFCVQPGSFEESWMLCF